MSNDERDDLSRSVFERDLIHRDSGDTASLRCAKRLRRLLVADHLRSKKRRQTHGQKTSFLLWKSSGDMPFATKLSGKSSSIIRRMR